MTGVMMAFDQAEVRKALVIAEQIKPLLAGHGPKVPGGVLAELLATWLSGFEPHMRELLLELCLKTTRELIELNDRIGREN